MLSKNNKLWMSWSHNDKFYHTVISLRVVRQLIVNRIKYLDKVNLCQLGFDKRNERLQNVFCNGLLECLV